MSDDYADVIFEVWRNGRNPDLVDYERVHERLHYGDETDDIASDEIRRQDRHSHSEDERSDD